MRSWTLTAFIVLAILISWIVWAPLVLVGPGARPGPAPSFLHLAGALGPLTAAFLVTAAAQGSEGVRRLFERCVGLRGRMSWALVGLAAPLLIFFVSVGVARIVGDEVTWGRLGTSDEYPALSRWQYWVASIFFYGFGEEVGWRGFALPRLQARRSALVAALIVGVVWALWHLPLFAFSGGLSARGIGGVLGWLFSIVTGSILMTFLFNQSGGSVLAVALFHGVLDILMTSPVAPSLPSIMGAILTVLGIAVVVVLRPTDLARAERQRET